MLLNIVSSDLYCWAWDRVYLKANGRIPCWCNAGEPHTIASYNIGRDFVNDVVNSSEFRDMRLKTHGYNLEYVSECKKCCCLVRQGFKSDRRYSDSEISTETKEKAFSVMRYLEHVSKTRNWSLGSIDRISEIQVEPSLPCNLSCPGCPQRDKPKLLKSEGPPYILGYDIFSKMLADCAKQDVAIAKIQYCGKGEPTLNKSLPEMIKLADSYKIGQSMDTNATHEFKQEYLLLNKINCSIDGSDEQSYNTYRRGGDFNKAIGFMTQAASQKGSSKCKIRWKYILFNTTESVYKLNRAQEIAKDIGIDELDFVITSCGAYDNSVRPTENMKNLKVLQEYIDNNRIFDNTIASRA